MEREYYLEASAKRYDVEINMKELTRDTFDSNELIRQLTLLALDAAMFHTDTIIINLGKFNAKITFCEKHIGE